MADAKAPLPALDPGNTPFWTGGQGGKLMVCRCGSCRRWLHPPVPVCRFCLSTDVTPEPSCGGGNVLTYTINRQQWLPALPPPITVVENGKGCAGVCVGPSISWRFNSSPKVAQSSAVGTQVKTSIPCVA